MNNNFENNLNETQFEDMRQQLNTLKKKLDEITFYDIYKAVDLVNEEGIFHFHENPNPECPIGRNIHKALDDRLLLIQERMENEMKGMTVADVAADVKKEIDAE